MEATQQTRRFLVQVAPPLDSGERLGPVGTHAAGVEVGGSIPVEFHTAPYEHDISP